MSTRAFPPPRGTFPERKPLHVRRYSQACASSVSVCPAKNLRTYRSSESGLAVIAQIVALARLRPLGFEPRWNSRATFREVSRPLYFEVGCKRDRPTSSRETPPRDLGGVSAFSARVWRGGTRGVVSLRCRVVITRRSDCGSAGAPIGAKVSQSLPETRAGVMRGSAPL